MADSDADLVVLYADIAGSTRLYEEYGDATARDAVAICIDILSAVAEQFEGRLVKTIGDEVLCVFHAAPMAVIASNEMQMKVKSAGEQGRFPTGPLRIKVGVHKGPGREEATDVFGEASTVASALVGLAKADEILTSGGLIRALPNELKAGSRFVDRKQVEGASEPLDVHELIWEVTGLTTVAATQPPEVLFKNVRCIVTFGNQDYEVNVDKPVLTFGRVEGNDVVVITDLTSRQHAQIELQRGRFHLSDNSSNGTVHIPEKGTPQALRRDRVALAARGAICLGGTPEANPKGLLTYRCTGRE